MSYTHEQVIKSSTDYFQGDELAASVFAGKYAHLQRPHAGARGKTWERPAPRLEQV